MAIGDLTGLGDDEVEELEKRGKTFGLGPEEVRAADELGMPLGRYFGLKGNRSIGLRDYEALRERERVEEQGREDAIRERATERAKAEMRSA